MRHLLTAILAVVIVAVGFTMFAGKCSGDTPSVDIHKPDSGATVGEELSVEGLLGLNSVVGQDSVEYHKYPIAESGNVKVYDENFYPDENNGYGDDVSSKEETCLIRYVDDKPVDTMILVGPYRNLIGDGSRCRVVVGVDTVNIDLKRPFSKTLDLRFREALPGCKFFRLSRHHALNDSSWPTDFQINIAMRDSTPLFIKDFISNMIRDDLAEYFKEHVGDDWVTPYVPMIRMRNRSVEQMMQHYYYQFRKFYDREYEPEPGSDERPFGEHYSYQYYACPVWQNSDSTLTTWKFYRFRYLGGAHGGEREYYLTFNNETGNILGASDFFTRKEARKAVETLRCQLNIYHEKDPGGEIHYYAWLDEYDNPDAKRDMIINDMIDGKIYPRPAITRHGIVFTYQTYDKGAYWDGILHFTQPFNKDFHLGK